MKRPLYDHSWSKIVERNDFAREILLQKIRHCDEVTSVISRAEGADVAGNVMAGGRIKHCLSRCLEHLEGSGSINEQDYYIYYGYASEAVKQAEKIIAEELSYLDL